MTAVTGYLQTIENIFIYLCTIKGLLCLSQSLFTAIEGDTMSPDFIPCEPGVSPLYP